MPKVRNIAKAGIEGVIKEYSQLKSHSKEDADSYLNDILTRMKTEYDRKVSQFDNAGVFSHAVDKTSAIISNRSIKDMSYNERIHELSVYVDFLNAKTSTLKGAEEVNREQDIRIFGADAAGHAKRRMTDQQRKDYWDLIDEFASQKSTIVASFASTQRIQEVIGEMTDGGQYEKEDMISIIEAAAEVLNAELTGKTTPDDTKKLLRAANVYSGTGDFVPAGLHTPFDKPKGKL